MVAQGLRAIHLVPPNGGGVDRCVRDLVGLRTGDWIVHVTDAQCVLEQPALTLFTPMARQTLVGFAAAGALGSPVVVHAHSTVATVRDLALELAAATGAPCVVTLHDVWFADPASGVEERTRRLAFVHGAAARTAPSRFILQTLRQALGDNPPCALVPNGTPPAPFVHASVLRPPTEAERHACGEHGFAIAVIGALGQHKGLQALEELSQRLPDGQRIVVFGYTERQLMPGWAVEGRVWVHGVFEPAQLPALVQRYQCRMALFPPGMPESFCYALTDAWNAGLTVLAPDHGALAERIQDHGGGALYPPQADAELIARRIGEHLATAMRHEGASMLSKPLPTAADMAAAMADLYAGLPAPAPDRLAVAAPLRVTAQTHLDGRFFRLEVQHLQALLQASAQARAELEQRLVQAEAGRAASLQRPVEGVASIGVLIVVYRPRLHELQAGLEAVAQARCEGLPVVAHLWHNDDGPQATPGLQDVIERLRAQGLPLRVDGGRGNLGFGRGINAALPAVEQPFVLLLNQDAIPEPGALQRLWQVAAADDARVAAWELRQIPYEHPKDYDPVTGDTVWCSGAAVLLRAQALRAVGGFEPRFFMYCEDVDLSWRLRCAGWRLRYLPRCAVVHHTYSEPGEIKPLAVLQGCYANLCLRARYAGRRQVLAGVRQLLHEMKGPQPFAGRRLGMARALLKSALDYPYFRRTHQAAPDFSPCLRGWDYEWRRDGPFHAFQSQAEQPQPRPLVTVLVRASGDATVLDEWLACIENQTHRPLEVIVVGGSDGALKPVCDRWADRLDLRLLPATTVALDDLAAAHARADWWLTMRDDLLLPHADHAEVLLGAAEAAGADAAVALTWVIQARHAERREAHRRHSPRTTVGGPPGQRWSRLMHRRARLRADPASAVEVGKVTTLQYGDASV